MLITYPEKSKTHETRYKHTRSWRVERVRRGVVVDQLRYHVTMAFSCGGLGLRLLEGGAADICVSVCVCVCVCVEREEGLVGG